MIGHTIPLKGQGSQEISCDSVVLGTYVIIKGSLDEKLPSYEVLKMLRE